MEKGDAMKKKKNKEVTLGLCEVGDIIQGVYSQLKLRVLEVEHAYGDVYDYKCVYIEGFCKDETTTVSSYMHYRKVTT